MNKRIKKKIQKRFNIRKYKNYKFLCELRKQIVIAAEVLMNFIDIYDVAEFINIIK